MGKGKRWQDGQWWRVNLQPTTKAQREVALRVHILPTMGSWPIASIAPVDVRSLVSRLASAGMSPSYVTKNLRILSQIMKAAVADRLIARNPCEGIQGPGEDPMEDDLSDSRATQCACR
jgi:site-specific recombinase XerC